MNACKSKPLENKPIKQMLFSLHFNLLAVIALFYFTSELLITHFSFNCYGSNGISKAKTSPRRGTINAVGFRNLMLATKTRPQIYDWLLKNTVQHNEIIESNGGITILINCKQAMKNISSQHTQPCSSFVWHVGGWSSVNVSVNVSANVNEQWVLLCGLFYALQSLFTAPCRVSVCVRAKSDGYVDCFHFYDIQ